MKRLFFISLILAVFISCDDEDTNLSPDSDYRQEMRDFVIGISNYGKASNAKFVIIPQNGIEIITTNGEEDGPVHTAYVNAIDGHGQEDLYYGYNFDNIATPSGENAYLRAFLNKSKNAGNTILVTDYCSTRSKMDDSYTQNKLVGYVPFAANERELNNIPNYPAQIFEENTSTITSLSQAKNFLYLINPENYSTKTAFISAVTATNYDLLIMDLFFHDDTEFSAAEVDQLKNKANGGKRLVVSYMSIGEAEDYRYYWQSGWTENNPSWLDSENPDWEGNFKVRYWEDEWQNIIFGTQDSYLQKILDANFDGVYLDIIEAYEHFE